MPAVRANDSEEVPSCYPEIPLRRSTRRKSSGPYQFPSPDSDETVATSGDTDRYLRQHRELSIGSEYADIKTSSTSEESFDITSVAPGAKFTEITISGVQLRPTVAFDTFWRFAAERKSIDDKRRAGESAP